MLEKALQCSRFVLSVLPVSRYCFRVYSCALSAAAPTESSTTAIERQGTWRNLKFDREEPTTVQLPSPKRPSVGEHSARRGEIAFGQYGVYPCDLGFLSADHAGRTIIRTFSQCSFFFVACATAVYSNWKLEISARTP